MKPAIDKFFDIGENIENEDVETVWNIAKKTIMENEEAHYTIIDSQIEEINELKEKIKESRSQLLQLKEVVKILMKKEWNIYLCYY